MSDPLTQSFTTPTRSNLGVPQSIHLGFRPKLIFMMGSAIPLASMGTWFEGPWGGFGWSALREAAGTIGQSAVGSGGWQSGHVPGGSYVGATNLAGVVENTNLRANQIHLETYDCDTSAGHANSGYTFTTSVALPTQVVPTIALGGNGIHAGEGSFSWPGAAGDVVISGLGFRPQLVLLVWSKTPSYNYPYAAPYNGASAGIGAASSSSAAEQYSHYGMELGDSAGYTIHRTGKIAVVQDSVSVLATAVLASMDADGFTLTFSGPDTGEATSLPPRLVAWLALRDDAGGFKVGNAVVPSSGGVVSYGGCGFKPDQVITTHGNAASANSVLYGGSWGVGMFDDTLQASFVSGPNLTGFPGFGAHRMSLASAVQFGTNNAATTDGEASRSSIDADGFSLNWTNVAAAGKPWGWIAMKTTGANRPCGGPEFVGQIIRRL